VGRPWTHVDWKGPTPQLPAIPWPAGDGEEREAEPERVTWSSARKFQIHLASPVPDGRTDIEIQWTIGAIDWGIVHAGVFQVWGVCERGSLWRIAEIYHTGKTIDWWADWIEKLVKAWKVRLIFADPSRNDLIKMLNDLLGRYGGRKVGSIVRPAENEWDAGRDRVAQLLGADGPPRMFFLETEHGFANSESSCRQRIRLGDDLALFGQLFADPELDKLNLHTSTELEIGDYIWADPTEERRPKEDVHPSVADDGCDCTRYGVMGAFKRDLTPRVPDGPDWDDLLFTPSRATGRPLTQAKGEATFQRARSALTKPLIRPAHLRTRLP
jgi:hypothetical protein